MAQKHVQTLLLLLVCIAHAQVPDFYIYKDGSSTPLQENSQGNVNTTIYYGSPYVFSVKMKDGSEGYTWCWRDVSSAVCTPGQSYVVSALKNENSTLTIRIRAERGSEEPKEKDLILEIVSAYIVSFNLDGGLYNGEPAIAPQTIWGNNKVSKPDNPKKVGYEFAHWYIEGTNSSWPFNFESTVIAGNITLVAKWNPITYAITYYLDKDEPPWDVQYYSLEDQVVMFPFPKDGCTRKFEGWIDTTLGTPMTNFIPRPGYEGDKTFYAKWSEKKKQRPSEALLSYLPPPPNGYEYNDQEQPLREVEKQEENGCEIGNIKVLYDYSEQAPKEVGIYELFVRFEGNDNYTDTTIKLPEKIRIYKYKLPSSPVFTYDIENKPYDGTNTAKAINQKFSDFPLFCTPKENQDYEISATFTKKDAEPGIPVEVKFIKWLDGPISKNCNLDGVVPVPVENKVATISKATPQFKIKLPVPDFWLSSPGTFRPEVITDEFVKKEGIITWLYRDKEKTEYSDSLPNARGSGSWKIKAILKETDNNYYGTEDSADFKVQRGGGKLVEHGIKIEGFKEESQFYFSENCKTDSDIVQNAIIQIEVTEPGIYFKRYRNGIFETPYSECSIDRPYCEGACTGEKCYMHYNIPITFGKSGLDTLIYNLSCEDGSCNDTLSLLIETALPFEGIVQQRWNNTLFVNNNPITNGGYSFITDDFTWFKNGEEIKNYSLQFYSAGQKSTDLLKTSDTYRVQMHYLKGNDILKISTCDGHSKPISTAVGSDAAFKKQVLGIGGKKASVSAKVYNSKGCKVSGNAPGVYLVEER